MAGLAHAAHDASGIPGCDLPCHSGVSPNYLNSIRRHGWRGGRLISGQTGPPEENAAPHPLSTGKTRGFPMGGIGGKPRNLVNYEYFQYICSLTNTPMEAELKTQGGKPGPGFFRKDERGRFLFIFGDPGRSSLRWRVAKKLWCAAASQWRLVKGSPTLSNHSARLDKTPATNSTFYPSIIYVENACCLKNHQSNLA